MPYTPKRTFNPCNQIQDQIKDAAKSIKKRYDNDEFRNPRLAKGGEGCEGGEEKGREMEKGNKVGSKGGEE